MQKMIVRERYLEKLRAGRGDTDVVKVITGLRRSGKSVLMNQYIDELRNTGVSEDDILFIDFEEFEGQDIKNKDELNEILKEKVPRDRLFYVFFDEIQDVDGWEMSVSALNHMKNVDVYITGSNSDMLSSQLATHIAGRHIEIKVFPLSFGEFMELHEYSDKDDAFKDYLVYGGLPAVDISRGRAYAQDYLQGVYSTVFIKDVAKNMESINLSKIKAISKFLCSNIGNITNTSTIASATGFSTNTVDSYIDAMMDALLFSYCPRYDMVGKKILNTNGKYYSMDLGLRNSVLKTDKDADISRPLENIVYLELLRRGYDVVVGSYRDAEVDFIAKDQDSAEYIQVCLTMMSEDTREREFRSLEKTRTNYPKTIITMDKYGLGNSNGIRIVNILDWLLSE